MKSLASCIKQSLPKQITLKLRIWQNFVDPIFMEIVNASDDGSHTPASAVKIQTESIARVKTYNAHNCENNGKNNVSKQNHMKRM